MAGVTADDLLALFDTVPPAWKNVLPGWTPERCGQVAQGVREVSNNRPIGPEDPFRALRLCDPGDVRVVILGQDPYPKPGHADGLAFSANTGKPASLRRVFQVLAQDKPGFKPPDVWRLDAWARQGVLLLNPTLTIEIGVIGSHMGCGWQDLTAQIVQSLRWRKDPPVWMLWGQKARVFFDDTKPAGCNKEELILATRHPSNDYRKQFMAEGSHFLQTAHWVDWWRLPSIA
jgi:uracil-DNA glycosylase